MPAMTNAPAHAAPSRRRPRLAKVAALGVLALVGTILLPGGASMAATAPNLGTAESFAVLGATTVTNTGDTVVNGDLGVSPGDAVTGFPPGLVVEGAIHAGDETAASAQSDARTAYNALAAQPCGETLTGTDLGDLTLTPGVYCFSSSAQLTGALTLDALGDPAAVFIFQIGTALTTASGSSVEFTDDFASCNVFWQVGSAATLGSGTDFVGTLIADTEAVIADIGAIVMGRLISLTAAVNLDTNVITATTCAAAGGTTGGDTTGGETTGETDGGTTGETTGGETTGGETTGETDGGTTGETTGGDTTGGDTTGGGATPELDLGGPGVPTSTTGGDGPRPELPVTGSNVGLAGIAMLAIAAGVGMVLVAGTKRSTAARHLRLTARRARSRVEAT
jgi:hypothetical protein